MDDRRTLALVSLTAAALLATLCMMTLASGVSQQWFEWVRDPRTYTDALVREGSMLRAIIALDDVFIAAYVTATVLFARTLSRGRLDVLPSFVIAGGVAAGLLDLEENHHLLALAGLADTGAQIPIDAILSRSVASQMKWMIGHVAFAIAGLAIPGRDAFTRVFRGSLIAWQLPIGALYWVATDTSLTVLTWLRYTSLILGFAAIGVLHWKRAPARDAASATGSSAPA